MSSIVRASTSARVLVAGRPLTRAALSHPGWTATDLQRHWGAARTATAIVGMKAEDGAMTQVRAAVDKDAKVSLNEKRCLIGAAVHDVHVIR